MRYRVSLIASGLLAALAIAGPVTAEVSKPNTSAVTKPGRTLVDPEFRGRHANTRFQLEFDMRRLANPAAAYDVHKTADVIATCIVERSGSDAPGYLGGGLAGDADYDRLTGALNGKLRRCARMTASSATATAISGSLAEQLVKASTPTFTDRAQSVNEDDARAFYGDLSGSVTFDSIAGCLAVYSPGLTYKVIQTESGSAAETSALTALFGQTPECGMSTAPSSVVPALYQRAALATALYQWTASS